MSLLSSFIIEPVVRHARRLSGVQAPEASSDRARALACDNDNVDAASQSPHNSPGPTPSTNQHSTSPPLQPEGSRQSTAGRPSTLIARSRGNSWFSNRPRDAVIDEDDDVRAGSATTAPIEIPANMSSNPARALADQFRYVDINSTATTPSTAPPAPGTRRRTRGQHAGAMSESLPADDGMAHLRTRIHEIRDLKITDQERARMIHGLMTERYHLMRPTSPSSFVSHERPFTPNSGASVFSDVHASSPYSSASDVDPENPYNLREGDTNPTYRPNSHEGAEHEEEEDEVIEGEMVLGCQHYKRNVKVQCFECKRWYTCRHCHDATEGHNLNRARTENMLCMACGTPQKAAEHCKECGTVAACYYCDICKLWDNNSKKKIYHCPDCGICRRGEGIGKDFYHCKVC